MSTGGVSNKIAVRVPGSTSNCGPGFDTLGIALSVYNTVELELSGENITGRTQLDLLALPTVSAAVALFAKETGKEVASLSYSIQGDVPIARGLGSSSTIAIGTLVGLDQLFETQLSKEHVARLGTKLEGHPDNAVASVFGGLTVPRTAPLDGRLVAVQRFLLEARSRFVVLIPELQMTTKSGRAVLPLTLPHSTATKNVNAAAYLLSAFISGNYSALRHDIQDFLHEPYRLPKIPRGKEVLAAGVSAGAYYGWLSGSGSSLLCFCDEERAERVGQAMAKTFADAGMPSVVKILEQDTEGAIVL